MIAITLSLVVIAALEDPMIPAQLREALQKMPTGQAAETLAEQVRAALPDDADLSQGHPWIDGEDVAFVLEAPADGPTPRLNGYGVRQQSREFIPIGKTGLWAVVLSIPIEEKFAVDIRVGRERVGGATIEMPEWGYPPESSERPGQEYGEYRPLEFRSTVFDNDRTGWIYIPAAYDGSEPAALMVFQDGDAYKRENVGTVVDNLITDGDMPVTVLVLLNPGVNDDGSANRSVEYDTLGDRYANFLETDVMPLITTEYNLIDDPNFRAIGGASSGGICAFTVAWERPDLFARVCSHIGSFTNIRGGNAYPEIVREAEPKPIKVVLHDGSNDIINRFGDWWEANNAMHAALEEKGYDVSFLTDRSFHAFWSAGRVLPETLRRTWEGWK